MLMLSILKKFNLYMHSTYLSQSVFMPVKETPIDINFLPFPCKLADYESSLILSFFLQ